MNSNVPSTFFFFSSVRSPHFQKCSHVPRPWSGVCKRKDFSTKKCLLQTDFASLYFNTKKENIIPHTATLSLIIRIRIRRRRRTSNVMMIIHGCLAFILFIYTHGPALYNFYSTFCRLLLLLTKSAAAASPDAGIAERLVPLAFTCALCICNDLRNAASL